MTAFLLLLLFLLLILLFLLAASLAAIRRLHKFESKKAFREAGHLFFYRTFFLRFFENEDFEVVLVSLLVAQSVVRFFAIALSVYLILSINLQSDALLALLLLFSMILFYTFTDFLPRIAGSSYPGKTLSIALPATSPFLILCSPLILPFSSFSRWMWNTPYFDYLREPVGEVKHEILKMMEEAGLPEDLSKGDYRLIGSTLRFQGRIAKEIMVPRIDIFSLNDKTSIRDAAIAFQTQGYSRVPVYKETIDQIIGILLYKDVLNQYILSDGKTFDEKGLDLPVETLVKPALFTPETKKISELLQEFRKRQMHLAIVVDEWGGTEGIVTIEDILEEIVGEIEDEYDEGENLYLTLEDGSLLVDARMTIIDLEEELGIKIPQEGDYDTLGGYIFHQAGTIPRRGFTIKLDDAEIEVLKSSERKVEKVKIKKISLPKEE